MYKFLGILPCIVMAGCFLQPKVHSVNEFFIVPLPSDTRVVGGNNVFSTGLKEDFYYPVARPGARLLTPEYIAHNTMYKQGAYKLTEQKYGTNTSVLFALSSAIEVSTLPDTITDSQSTVVLVNIDPTSDQYLERTPLMIDFKSAGTELRPENLLTIMPYFGFTLEPSSLYAAIVFDGVTRIDGSSLEKTTLFQDINSPWDAEMQINASQHEAWQEHKAIVNAYVNEHTDWNADNIVAFTVYSTRDIATDARALRDGLNTLTDADIRSMIMNNTLSLNYTAACTDPLIDQERNQITLTGNIAMPRWQSGSFPYLETGGEVRTKMLNGKVVIPTDRESVPFQIEIPCVSSGALIVAKNGGGSDATSATRLVSAPIIASGKPLDAVIVGIGQYMSSTDRSFPGIDFVFNLASYVGLMQWLDRDDFANGLRTNPMNPKAAAGNQLQSAAETYIAKRVAENLAWIVENHIDLVDVETSGLSDSSLIVVNENVGYVGHSEGANHAMINMMMDDAYNYAHYSSGSGLSTPLYVDNAAISTWTKNAFPALEYDELDYFHPVVNFIQTVYEEMDSINYVDYVDLENLLVTAGIDDDQTAPGGTHALAVALARRGLLEATGVVTGYNLLDVEGFIDVLQKDPIMLPTVGNLGNGGTGVFAYYDGGHFPWAWWCDGGSGEFLYTASHGGAATVDINTGPTDCIFWDAAYFK